VKENRQNKAEVNLCFLNATNERSVGKLERLSVSTWNMIPPTTV